MPARRERSQPAKSPIPATLASLSRGRLAGALSSASGQSQGAAGVGGAALAINQADGLSEARSVASADAISIAEAVGAADAIAGASGDSAAVSEATGASDGISSADGASDSANETEGSASGIATAHGVAATLIVAEAAGWAGCVSTVSGEGAVPQRPTPPNRILLVKAPQRRISSGSFPRLSTVAGESRASAIQSDDRWVTTPSVSRIAEVA